MRKLNHFLVLFFIFTILTMLSGCISADEDSIEEKDLLGGNDTVEDKDTVKGTGAIIYLDFEGGFYGITADDGEKYDPINLHSDFKKDGLRVIFTGKIRDDLMSFHMWGELIELISMEVEKQ